MGREQRVVSKNLEVRGLFISKDLENLLTFIMLI